MQILPVSKNPIQDAYISIYDALEKAKENDEVQIKSGAYDEILVIRHSMTIVGDGNVTFLKDVAIVPEVEVIFENIQFSSYIEFKEANVRFINCSFRAIPDNATIQTVDSHLHFTNCNFFAYNTKISSSYLKANDSHITLTDCTFEENNEAISAENCTITVSNSTFTKQLSRHISLNQGKLSMVNTRLEQSVEAIHSTGSTIEMNRCHVNEHAKTQLTLIDANATLLNNFFQKAQTHLHLTNSHGALTNNTFTQTKQTQLILEKLSTINATDNEFSFGEASAIFANDSIVHFEQTKFHHHTNKEQPQLHLLNCQTTLRSCRFYNGANRSILSEQDSTLTLTNCTFASFYDTVVTVNGGKTDIDECHFQPEFANTLKLENSVEATIQHSHFTLAKESHIIAIDHTRLNLLDCQFERSGHIAVSITESQTSMDQLTFAIQQSEAPALLFQTSQFEVRNTLFTNIEQAAVHIEDDSHGSFLNVFFQNNTGTNITVDYSKLSGKNVRIDGGNVGLHSFNSNVTLSQFRVEHSQKAAIWTQENGHLMLADSYLARNAAHGLKSEYCTLSLDHVKFERNGTGADLHGSTSSIANSNFFKNKTVGLQCASGSISLNDVLFSDNKTNQFEATLTTGQFTNVSFTSGDKAIVLQNRSNITASNVEALDHKNHTVDISNSVLIGSNCRFLNGGDYGLHCKDSQLTFTNSLFANHATNEFYLENNSQVVLTNSKLQPRVAEERGAFILDDSTLSRDGYMMYRKRSI
ncbi:right-handed parallel beta-helix repeat-containing protein [Kurthia senegalensis]|uniref:right-handed parallel beta-helix repeat-containing protein n=1 Tax=Kurthia senegalensis TaxID=1033740 RepID=UPI0002891DC3|nr:right-handed parallel beta-helix repeat-containing protein [Kurthia senegalensis]